MNTVISVRTLFWTKTSRTFQGLSRTHFPFFKDSIQCKKEPWVYVFFSSTTTWAILSWRSFILGTWESGLDKVSTEIQGLSSNDCNFQRLSRCVRTLSHYWVIVVKLGFHNTIQNMNNDRLVSHRKDIWVAPSSQQTRVRDGPLENLWGGGAVEVQKKYSRKWKLNEKKFLHANYSQKNIHAIHTRNLITKKIPAARKFPSPSPHNFSNGPSLKINITCLRSL